CPGIPCGARESRLCAAQFHIRSHYFRDGLHLHVVQRRLRRVDACVGGLDTARVASPEIQLPAGVETGIEQIEATAESRDLVDRQFAVRTEFVAIHCSGEIQL